MGRGSSFGNSVTNIGKSAFWDCTSLASITIGNGVTSIGGSAFRNCTSLASITIPDSVTSIDNGAFEGCTSLESITIGNGVANIGNWAFQLCTSLESINVASANMHFSSIDGALFDKNQTTLVQYPVGRANTSYSIPDSVESIGDLAFQGCTSLASITIPAQPKISL